MTRRTSRIWIAGSNLDEGTNQKVMAGVSDPDQPETTKPRPRIFGGNAGAQGAGGAGLSTLRQGIRDGIREFRDGVRDAVKTVTGHSDDRAGSGDSVRWRVFRPINSRIGHGG